VFSDFLPSAAVLLASPPSVPEDRVLRHSSSTGGKQLPPLPAKESTSAGRNYIVFPSLAEMADTESGKRASLSLCSDGAPSVQFRRHFLFSETGTRQTITSPHTCSSFFWFAGDYESATRKIVLSKFRDI
jgi:hypothetical protein